MYLRRTLTVRGLVQFGWKQCLLFAGLAALVAHAHTDLGWTWVSIGARPLAALATATAILLGFRNNSAYQRWWEARKIWGGILNESRSLGMQLTTLIRGDDAEAVARHKDEGVKRHLAYISTLRLLLRKQEDGWEDVEKWLPDCDGPAYEKAKNRATQLLQRQSEEIAAARAADLVDGWGHFQILDTIRRVTDLQGKAERIAKTPLPRHYGFFTTLFVWIFALLFPFAVVSELGWRVVPLATLVGWIFISAEQVGRYTEDPFANFKHDVPMSALCRTAEIDLLQQLGETEIPEPLQPVANVLM